MATDDQAIEAALIEELEEHFRQAPPIGEGRDAMHLFFGLSEAIHQLGAKSVAERLQVAFPWYKGGLDIDASVWPEDVETHVVVDALADFVTFAGDLFSAWLVDHGLGEVKLTCYMPCHKRFTTVQFLPRAAF